MYYRDAPGLADYFEDGAFSTMEKALAFLAKRLAEEFQKCDYLDENQKLSAYEITEEITEHVKVIPGTQLLYMMYSHENLRHARLNMCEMEIQ
jgi:hypothetical protein